MHDTTTLPSFYEAIGGSAYDWLLQNKALEQILERGFAELPIDPQFLTIRTPHIYLGMQRIIDSYGRNECFGVRESLPDEFGEDMERGLVRRADEEEHDPNKFWLHWCHGIEALWQRQGAPIEILGEFSRSVGELDYAAWDIACELGTIFDEQNQLMSIRPYWHSLKERFAGGPHLTRILDYLPHYSEAPDAKVHIDRCGLTVHWESTHPGLVLFDKEKGPVEPNDTSKHTVLIFPGRKMGIAGRESWCDFPGLVHGVRDQQRNSRSMEDRRAIVSFPHLTMTPEDVAYYNAHAERFKPNPDDYPI